METIRPTYIIQHIRYDVILPLIWNLLISGCCTKGRSDKGLNQNFPTNIIRTDSVDDLMTPGGNKWKRCSRCNPVLKLPSSVTEKRMKWGVEKHYAGNNPHAN